MNSSDKSRQSAPLFHGILAVYMPCSVLIPIALTATAVFPGYVSAAAIFSCAALTAVGASFIHSLLDARTEHRGAHLRTGIVFILLSWILSSFFRSGVPFPQNLLPSAVQITAAAASFYTWLETTSLRNIFALRNTLLSAIDGKTGSDLQRVMRDELTLTTDINAQMKAVPRRYLLQCTAAALIPAGCVLAGVHIPFAVAVSYMFLAAGALCIWAVMRFYRAEQESAGEGVSIPAAERAGKITAVVICTAVASVPAFLLSSDRSLLPQSLIERFFTWLSSLFHVPISAPASGTFIPPPSEGTPYIMPNPADTVTAVTVIDLSGLITWLKYGVFALGAIAFFWFLIKPLFEKRNDSRKILTAITQWFARLGEAVSGFFRALRAGGTRGMRMERREQKEREDGIRRSLSSRSAHNKKEIEKSAAAFARLIVWAETNWGAVWSPQQAPAEFCAAAARLCSGGADIQNGIIHCGTLFERILYAPDEGADVSRRRREEFEKLVRNLTLHTNVQSL